MATKSEVIETKLTNGASLYIEVPVLSGEEQVSTKVFSFQEVTHVLEGIATAVATSLETIKPQQASVEFGLEVALESGQLTTLLVKGSATANLKITLQWGEASSP
jgi:hypothetical protein